MRKLEDIHGRSLNPSESLDVVRRGKALLQKPDAYDVDLADFIYDEFFWGATVQTTIPWNEIHDKLNMGGSGRQDALLRFELAMMLDELERWLDA